MFGWRRKTGIGVISESKGALSNLGHELARTTIANILKRKGVEPSPERVRTIKESCLERMILFGEDALRTAVKEFIAHYHGERNHQGSGNRIIFPNTDLARRDGPIRCRSRFGGMLNYYDRAA